MAKELLEEELLTDRETCGPEELESYADLLARYTNGLGIVEDLLSDTRITDVYINAPADTNPVHVVMDGEECASNVFLSQDDLDARVDLLDYLPHSLLVRGVGHRPDQADGDCVDVPRTELLDRPSERFLPML